MKGSVEVSDDEEEALNPCEDLKKVKKRVIRKVRELRDEAAVSVAFSPDPPESLDRPIHSRLSVITHISLEIATLERLALSVEEVNVSYEDARCLRRGSERHHGLLRIAYM